MKFPIIVADRKDLVLRLEQLTGERRVYAGAPTFAYHVGDFKVGRWVLEIDAVGDGWCGYINTLLSEGLISNAEGEPAPEPQEARAGGDDADADTSQEPAEQPARAAVVGPCKGKQDGPVKLEVSVPLEGHTYQSLANIVNTIFSRGVLLSKSTNGFFFASSELVDNMRSNERPQTLSQAIHIITEFRSKGELFGLYIDENEVTGKHLVTFDGFGVSPDIETTHAWATLAASINKACLEHRRILARKVKEPNEKFSMRVWITRIGMGGPECKKSRSILYKNLAGHTAFRTQESADNWKAKHQTKGENNEQVHREV